MRSSFGRIFGVLVAPTATFQSIKAWPTWVVALVVIALVTAAATYGIVSHVDWSSIPKAWEKAVAAQDEISAEKAFAVMKRAAAPMAGGGAVFMVVIPAVVGALVMQLLMKLVGGDVSYKMSLSVWVHAAVPTAVGTVLTLLVALTRDHIKLEDVKSGGLLMSNLGVFAPESAGATLRAALTEVDIFAIWGFWLLALGYAVVSDVSKGKVAVLVIVVAVAFSAISVGMAAIAG